MSSIVSEECDFVIGVDTHAATHTFAVVAGSTGAVRHLPDQSGGARESEGLAGLALWRCSNLDRD